jgi:hypothetical protein
MGYEHKDFMFFAEVSRHNSPRDDTHDALWEELVQRVTEIVQSDKYKPINAMIR